MATSDKTRDSKWKQVVRRIKTNERKSKQAKGSDVRFQNETKGQSGSWRTLFKFLCNV